MADDVVGSARIRVELDGDQATIEARILGRRIKRALDQETRNAGAGLFRSIDGRLRDARGRFVAEGRALGGALSNGMASGFDASRLFRALRSVGSGLSKFLVGTTAVTLLSASLSGLAANALALTSALAPAAGALAAIPASAGLAGAAVATLATALFGVGDAFSSAITGDAAEFQEALAGLAPAAANVARELRAARPAFDELRRSVQGALFAPLEGAITRLVAALRGPLTAGMTAAAAEIGRLGATVTRFGASTAGVSLVTQLFGTLRTILAGIRTDTLDRLLAAVAAFTSATLPAFQGIGDAIDGVLGRFTDFLNRAAAGGQALAWVEGAIAVFRQLGAIAADIIGIFASITSAVNASGNSILGTIGSALEQFRQFLNTAQGQTAVVQIFEALGQVGSALGPVFGALATQIGAIAPVVGQLAQVIGPILTQAIAALGPAIAALGPGVIAVFQAIGQAVNKIASSGALQSFAQAISGVLSALAPLGPALGQLITSGLQVVTPLLQLLAPIVRAVSTALAGVVAALAPVISALVAQLMPVLQPLSALFAQFAGVLGQALVLAIQQAGPALVQMVGALGQVLVAAIPLVQALLPLVPIIGQLAGEILGGLLPALVPLVQQFAQLLRVIVPPLAAVLRVLAQVIGTILTVAVRANINGNRALIGILTTLTGLIVGAVVAAFRLLSGVVVAARTAFGVFSAGVRGVMGLLRGLAGFLAGAVVGAWRGVTSAVNTLRGAISGLSGPISAVIGALSRLVGMARSAFNAVSAIPGGGAIGGLFGFADGGIIRRPTVGLVGEAGPEVIIPLTRPARARQLADQSGLTSILAQALPGGKATQAARGDVHNTWHIYGNSDPEQTAKRILNRMVLAGGF